MNINIIVKNLQSKKKKNYDYEYYNGEDYCDSPRVKENKRKNYCYEEGDDDDNSRNKKDTKKRRYQKEEHKDYCNGKNEESSDNNIDKTNKKKHHLKKGISNYLK